MTDWDLVVVGAGPAGAATALAALRASPDLRVLLLDLADFPRDKSCGDGIAPLVVETLTELGAADVVHGWEPLRYLQLGRGTVQVAGPLASPVWVIPREVFDARLVEQAVAAGATLRRHRVRRVEVSAGSTVEVDDVWSAQVVVGADGAHSAVARALGRTVSRNQALAIRGYAPTPPGRAARQVIAYGDRRQPSYAWSFDRGDGLSNVGYGELLGSDGRSDATRDVLLEQLERLLPGSSDGKQRWRAHHLPLSDWRWHQPDGPVLLVGDAAGLVNPMTGEGIYYAVATGALAGRCAARAIRDGVPYAAGAGHRAAVRRLLARHLRHTAAASRLSRSPTIVEAGIRAATRHRGAFEDLVELGLGRGTITPRLAVGLAAGLATRRSRGQTTSDKES